MTPTTVLVFSNTTTTTMATTPNNNNSKSTARNNAVDSLSLFRAFQKTTVGSSDVTIHRIVPPPISVEPYIYSSSISHSDLTVMVIIRIPRNVKRSVSWILFTIFFPIFLIFRTLDSSITLVNQP